MLVPPREKENCTLFPSTLGVCSLEEQPCRADELPMAFGGGIHHLVIHESSKGAAERHGMVRIAYGILLADMIYILMPPLENPLH